MSVDLTELRAAVDALKAAAQNVSPAPPSDVSQADIDALTSEVESVTSELGSSPAPSEPPPVTGSPTSPPAAVPAAETVQTPWAPK